MSLKIQEDNEKLKIILCYPYPTQREFKRRIRELQDLGIREILLEGEKRIIDDLKVLGKGYEAVVVKAKDRNGRIVALKIRRVDYPKSMVKEAEITKIASKENIAPKIYAYTDNIIVREYIEGKILVDWVKKASENEIRKIIFKIIEKAYKLDKLGINHKELSRAPKHIIITEEMEPYIIDFGAASKSDKPKNLTSITQYLLIRKGEIQEKIRKALNLTEKDIEQIISILREYKKAKTPNEKEKAYKGLLQYLQSKIKL